MDLAGTDKAVKRLNDETLPAIEQLLDRKLAQINDLIIPQAVTALRVLVTDLNEVIDRLDGIRIVSEIRVPPRPKAG